MNKDMENVFNRMAELGGSDERLGTNDTPFINAPLLPKNARPAAPVEGLEADHYRYTRTTPNGFSVEHYQKEPPVIGKDGFGSENHSPVAYVLRSQAEAIVATRDAEWQVAANLGSEVNRNLAKRVNALEADNAALTARVKEYVEARNAYEQAIAPKGAFGELRTLSPNAQIILRYRDARLALEGRP